jgi:hypothetical protein
MMAGREFVNFPTKVRRNVVRNITATGAGSLAVRREARGGEVMGSTAVIDM